MFCFPLQPVSEKMRLELLRLENRNQTPRKSLGSLFQLEHLERDVYESCWFWFPFCIPITISVSTSRERAALLSQKRCIKINAYVIRFRLRLLLFSFKFLVYNIKHFADVDDISKYHVCVCCFVLLTRYWGIVTVPGSFLKAGDLGWPDPHPPP